MKDLLPIGSVILPKEATKSLLIVGIMQADEDGNSYDYICVPFPEGYINAETFFLLNHEDVEKVYFVGCINAESQTYIQMIKNYEMEKANSEVKNDD